MAGDGESENSVSDDDTPVFGGGVLGNKLEAALLLKAESLGDREGG